MRNMTQDEREVGDDDDDRDDKNYDGDDRGSKNEPWSDTDDATLSLDTNGKSVISQCPK